MIERAYFKTSSLTDPGKEEIYISVHCMASGALSFLKETGLGSDMTHDFITTRLDKIVEKVTLWNTIDIGPEYRKPAYAYGGPSFITTNDNYFFERGLFRGATAPKRGEIKEEIFLDGFNYRRLKCILDFKESIGPSFIAILLEEGREIVSIY